MGKSLRFYLFYYFEKTMGTALNQLLFCMNFRSCWTKNKFLYEVEFLVFNFRLKPLDIEFMKKLHNKVNIVPVIAKADCLTKKEIERLKSRVLKEIENNGIKIYPLPDCDSDEDEDYKEQVRQLKEAVPFAVCGSTTVLEVKGKKVIFLLVLWIHNFFF